MPRARAPTAQVTASVFDVLDIPQTAEHLRAVARLLARAKEKLSKKKSVRKGVTNES